MIILQLKIFELWSFRHVTDIREKRFLSVLKIGTPLYLAPEAQESQI